MFSGTSRESLGTLETAFHCGWAHTERFDESLLLIRKSLGWRHHFLYRRQNVTPNRPARLDIPRDALDTIEHSNQLDMRLYESVQSSFENALADNRIDAAALITYRKKLVLYQRLFRALRKTPSPVRRLAKSLSRAVTN